MLKSLQLQVNVARLTLVVAMLFLLLAASLFHNTGLMVMAALLWGAWPASWLVGRWGSRALSVARRVPATGTVGEVVEGEIRVCNAGGWPLFLVRSEPGAADGVPIIAPAQHEIAWLRRGECVTWTPRWALKRRGVHHLTPARAGVWDALGLSMPLQPDKRQPDGGELQITVLPRVVRIDRLGFLGGASPVRAGGNGERLPDALDFHGVRPYRPGEGIRRIHWRSTARTDVLHVVEWEEPIGADIAVLLDLQAAHVAGSADDNTLEAAITLAASAGAYLLEQGFNFQLFCWQNQTRNSKPKAQSLRVLMHEARNARGLGEMLHFLARLEPVDDDAADLSALARAVSSQIAPGRDILILASSAAPIAPTLRLLEGRRGRTHVLALDAVSFGAASQKAGFGAPSFAPASERIRLVRRGDSLSGALER